MSMPPTFARDFRRTLLWIPRITFPVYLYGAVTLCSLGIPPEFELTGSGVPGSEHHTAAAFLRRLRFALYPLRSPLLRASQLVSFPPRTRMLRFRGLPFLAERPCGQEVTFGDRRITGSWRRPDAFRSLARPSSAPEPSHSPDSMLATDLSA